MGRDKAIFGFYELGSLFKNPENAYISAQGQKIKKIKALYFLKLLKLKKRKYPYLFVSLPLFRDMVILLKLCPCPGDKIRKWPYLGSESIKSKNKVTLLSLTLKVGENKVPLFFLLVAPFLRYWPCY